MRRECVTSKLAISGRMQRIVEVTRFRIVSPIGHVSSARGGGAGRRRVRLLFVGTDACLVAS